MQSLADAIRSSLVDGQLPCARAFVIARQFQVEPLRIGDEADALGISLSRCQLGLFGYGPKAEGKHKRVKAMENVPPRLAQALHAAAGATGKLSCAEAWRIAKEMHLSRQAVSNAVEGLGLRITPCQLGAFRAHDRAASSK